MPSKSEFEFIEHLRRKFGRKDKRIITGIGDDAAVISQNSRKDLVISADMLVEDIDFELRWTTARQLGHKALAISLSDMAAMGAIPLWSIISIGIPQVLWEADFLNEFYDGWEELASRYKVKLAGGDISKTPDKIVIDSVVGGEVRKGRAVKRSGAKPGDLIYVSGQLGGAAAGLRSLKNNDPKAKYVDELIKRQLVPQPRCEIGKSLGDLQIATAMIDISDGLSSDLTHLCRESGVGSVIDSEKVPVDKNVLALGYPDAFDLALNGGEDFELLFTVPPRLKADLRNKLGKLPVTHIGVITEGDKIELQNGDEVKELQSSGYQHF